MKLELSLRGADGDTGIVVDLPLGWSVGFEGLSVFADFKDGSSIMGEWNPKERKWHLRTVWATSPIEFVCASFCVREDRP